MTGFFEGTFGSHKARYHPPRLPLIHSPLAHWLHVWRLRDLRTRMLRRHPRNRAAACPLCQQTSTKVHCRYFIKRECPLRNTDSFRQLHL
jgi:hypothetical protein